MADKLNAYDVMGEVSRVHGYEGHINPEFLTFVRDYPHGGWDYLARGTGYDPLVVCGAYHKVMDDAREMFKPVGGWTEHYGEHNYGH